MKNPFNIHCWSPICRNLNDVVVLLNNLPISDSWWKLPLLPPQHATHNPTHSHSTFPLLSLPFQRNHHLDSNSSPYNNFPSFGTGFSRIARVCRAYQTAMWHRNAVCHSNSQQHIYVVPANTILEPFFIQDTLYMLQRLISQGCIFLVFLWFYVHENVTLLYVTCH